jgi:hypothetical protein
MCDFIIALFCAVRNNDSFKPSQGFRTLEIDLYICAQITCLFIFRYSKVFHIKASNRFTSQFQFRISATQKIKYVQENKVMCVDGRQQTTYSFFKVMF